MNIIEAIKSGKRFKRKDWDDSMFIDNDYFLNNPNSIKVEFLLSDDWEIEQKAVPITLDQFWDAYNKARKTIDHPNSPNLICDFMARELGL